MGLALVAGLSTSCSNGDWEDSLQGGTANGGNNGKISVYFSMQAPIRVITLGNDDDAVNTDDNASVQAAGNLGWWLQEYQGL